MEGIKVKLTVELGIQPKFLKAPPLPYALKPKVDASLTELVKDGVLEPVSVSKWATSIVPVLKKMEAEGSVGTYVNDLFAGLTGGQK